MGSIGSYATNRANAKSALAQGRAARDAAYVNAANTEAESASALRLAAENMATARRNQTAATASVRAGRGASGFTSEGSGSQAELAAAEVLEKQISDLSLGAAISDQSKRHEAAMQRWEGDAALVSAQNQAAAYKSAASGALVSTGLQLGGALIGGIGAGMGLDVGVLCTEQLAGALDGDVLHLIHIGTAAVVALAGQALGVLVGEDAAHSGHDGGRDDVLAGDELDIFPLAGQLTIHGRSQLRVGLFHEADGIHHIVVHTIYPSLSDAKNQFARASAHSDPACFHDTRHRGFLQQHFAQTDTV